MANDYFTNPNNLVSGNRARASDVEVNFQQIETAFSLLPARKTFFTNQLSYVVDAGGANSMIATGDASITALVDGMQVRIKAAYA